MNDIYNKRKNVRVPVKLVNGRWECIFSGVLPIEEGTAGDLLVDRSSIKDEHFLSSLEHKSKHKVLDSGTVLLVALTIKAEPKLEKSLMNDLISRDKRNITLAAPYYFTLRSDQTRFVEISINGPTDKQKINDPTETGGVWLHVEGGRVKSISTGRVKVPNAVSKDCAESLNHAFTLLSEKYEPWRQSHTGNIYERILYRERNNQWYPLDILRNASIAKDEHQLVREQWKNILHKLNL